jgi:hypothetical protein
MNRGAPEERPGRLYLSDVYDLAAGFRWEEEERGLSPNQRFVIVTLFKFMGGKDHCFPKQETLAKATGICIRQIKTVLKELVRIGVIERNRGQAGWVYEYRFTKAFIQSTKGAIHAPLKVQPVHPQGATCAPTRCNLMHSKVPEKQASHGRAGAEYIKNRSKNKSVNQSGTDGLTEKEISDKKPASEDVDPLAWNDGFAPRPGAPPRLTSEQINALFGGPGPRSVNLLDCPEGDIHLSGLVDPFKKGPEVIRVIGFDPDTPQAEWFEEALKEFYREVIDRHWNRKATSPGAPFRRLFYRAGRSGLLYEFGFRPLSPVQQEARRREEERQEEEAAEAARIREEERRRLAEREAKLKAFINRPVVRDYLSCMGIPPRDYKNHLREIVARLNGRGTLTAVEQFMREKLQNDGF